MWLSPQNVMLHLGKGDFTLIDKIPISTIELPKRRFQKFADVSLPAREANMKVVTTSK